ncbi:MAG: 16S rRNA (cytosine(967)-C(5))-methyltransferase RsmB [Ruminococcaceae bacterium]|nr:16S rRNA (cytosine(967)-C(5))-methyltransferase RsmB [Oscillospiraceae bacterium]
METKTTPRRLAMQSLLACEKCGKYTNLEIDAGIRGADMSDADKGLYTRLVYGVSERRLTLDYIIDRYACNTKAADLDADVRTALRIGLYQMCFMDRIPEFAAVSESVSLVNRGKGGFVNAILRSFLRDGKKIVYPDGEKDPFFRASVYYSMPVPLVKLFVDSYGWETAENILACVNGEPDVYLRCNTERITPAEAAALTGGTVDERFTGMIRVDSVTETVRGGLEKGLFFVQDGASRLCAMVLDAKPGEKIVDTCACPGGKSFSAALDMQNKGEVYSFDLHGNKLSLIDKTAGRLGLTIIRTGVRDARKPDETLIGCADRVLCDAPCSGLGVIAKKPDIRYKDISDIENLPRIQTEVLAGAAQYVRPGGVLVYSTCTLHKKENEEVVKAFLADHPDFALSPFETAGVESEGMLTLFPHIHHTDGFFIARMVKKA